MARSFRLVVACALAVGVGASAAPAEAGDPQDFSQWKNRPREAFGDAQRTFERVRKMLLEQSVDDRLTGDDLLRSAVAGMAGGSGRKWDKLLSPAELAEVRSELSGQIAGIGVEIRFDSPTGAVTVVNPVPGSPAERAHIQAGDRILKIDGRSYKGQEIRDVVATMRGKVGTPVQLTILRDDHIVEVAVERGAIAMPLVADRALEGGASLLKIRLFNDRTPQQLREALGRLQVARGIVLDLRDNQGGLLDRMIECASLLLPAGKTVATSIGRGGKETPLVTSGEPLLKGQPVVVLQNGDTASGAELLADALRHHAGAMLVGKRTLGKWNVQRIEELPNRWALKFTVGVFRSARGDLPDGRGLDPDVEVEMSEGALDRCTAETDPARRVACDPQLRAALGLLAARR